MTPSAKAASRSLAAVSPAGPSARTASPAGGNPSKASGSASAFHAGAALPARARIGGVDAVALAFACQHRAGAEQRGAVMQRPVHAACLQRVGHGRIAAAFVDGPFGIGVDLPNAVGLAEAGDGAGGLAPVRDRQ
ncbi:hypothetical protein G6F31_017431 [Rhizopus arrhizus]|nr:hypothetical protein G6F31_017431 [Rhizopus arrhizus]